MVFDGYPFIRYVLMLIIGIVIYHFWPLSLNPLYFLALPVIFLLARYASPQLRGLVISAGLLFLGYAVSSFHDFAQNKNHFSTSDFDYYLVKTREQPENKPKTYKTLAEVKAIKKGQNWEAAQGKILLYFIKKEGQPPSANSTYIIKGMPREIEDPKNPYEFNYKRYLAQKGILAHHFLRPPDFKLLKKGKEGFFLALRRQAATKLASFLTDKKEFAIAEALVLGKKDDLDAETQQVFSDSGAVHILAVSGLHVGIVLLLIRFILSRLLKIKETTWVFFIVVLLAIWFYAFFTGAKPSVLRAAFMFSVLQTGSLVNRPRNPINALGISAFFLLLVNPNYLYDVGFQLSYSAVLGILLVYPTLNLKIKDWHWSIKNIGQLVIVSFAAQLLTFPLVLYYFNQFPAYFLLTNLFASFMAYAVVVVGLASMLPIVGSLFGYFLPWLVGFLLKAVSFVANLPFSVITEVHPTSIQVLLMYGVILFLLVFFSSLRIIHLKIATAAVVVLLVSGLYSLYISSQQKEITFHYIPKGSGISVIENYTANFYSDSLWPKQGRNYGFHLKNYYGNKKIKDYKPQLITKNSLFKFWGESFFWLKTDGEIPKATYIVVSNNSLQKKQMNKEIETLLLDGSNTKAYSETIAQISDSLGINYVSLYNNGFYTIKVE